MTVLTKIVSIQMLRLSLRSRKTNNGRRAVNRAEQSKTHLIFSQAEIQYDSANEAVDVLIKVYLATDISIAGSDKINFLRRNKMKSS